jgi:CelD/BcsL family acetyltransferase involved in cellulose biosynthesis
VTAGNTTVGLFCNFAYQRRVLFYQSSVNYGITDKSESPGLLIHSLSIDHNAALGHNEYDLLAGDSQYKRTLATHSNYLWLGALQAPRMKHRAKRYARHRYRSLRRWGTI